MSEFTTQTHHRERRAGRDTPTFKTASVERYPFNKEFTSNSPEEVRHFYDHFRSRDELVAWMKERPPGRAELFEVDGKKDVIVVIPTSAVEGPLATRCRTQLFRGQHIIFVDSKGLDPLFNYARNVNKGVRRALEIGSKWVIVANDDTVGVDPISTLVLGLEKIDPEKTTIAYPVPFSTYHSVKASLVYLKKWAYPLLRVKRAEIRKIHNLSMRFGVKYEFMPDHLFRGGYRGLAYRPFISRVAGYVDTVSFGVYSSRLALDLGGKLYDEVYINHTEESDLAFRMWMKQTGIRHISFRVDEGVGTTLGTGQVRFLRNVASLAYLNYKIEYGLLEIPQR